MLTNREKIRDPVERFVGDILDFRFGFCQITYENMYRSTSKGRFLSDFDIRPDTYSPQVVMLEVTKSGIFDIDPKHDQRQLMGIFTDNNANYEYAIVFLQHLLDISGIKVFLGVMEYLIYQEMKTNEANSILTAFALNFPIDISDKNKLHKTINWDVHTRQILAQL